MSILIPFLISLFMGLGVGGGGLFIIYLTSYLGLAQIDAQGTNLIFFIISAAASLIIHLRKRKFYPVQVVLIVAFGAIGSYIFSHFSNTVDPDIPRKILGGILVLGGGVSIFGALKSFFIR